ncbi:MAG: DUF418 domain-containing protein [Rubripirellula sp.]
MHSPTSAFFNFYSAAASDSNSSTGSPVGRMALTNYLAQTLICTTLFYGHGFALYGSVSRLTQVMIVIAIWVIQILGSRFWMARHAFGPCEYAWRTLTYLHFPARIASVDATSNQPSADRSKTMRNPQLPLETSHRNHRD